MTSRRRDDLDCSPQLAEDVRRAVASSPDEATAARHLAAMAAEARAVQDLPPTPAAAPRRRRGVIARGLAGAAGAVASLALVTTGLAVAGVDLPEPARAPFDAVGVELPNQEDDEARESAPAERPGTTPPASTNAAPPAQERAGGRRGEERRNDRAEGERKGGTERGQNDRGRDGQKPGAADEPSAPGAEGRRGGAGGGSQSAPGQAKPKRPAKPKAPRKKPRPAKPERPTSPQRPDQRQERIPDPPTTITTPEPAPEPETVEPYPSEPKRR